MSVPREPDPALLFLSIFAREWDVFWSGLQARLEERFGPLAYCSEPFPFDETHYYATEFGEPLSRRVLGFARYVPQESLPDIKLATNALETDWSDRNGHRLFNLDPGLLTLERLVLATGKNFGHRIYLGRGIWADLTLVFSKGAWQVLPWTFPDYAGSRMQEHLNRLRELYHTRRKAKHPSDKEMPCPEA